MRKPASFLDDVSLSAEDENFDPADPLCCPDDPFDEVLKYIPLLDDKILEGLGVDCSSLPPPHGAQLVLYSSSAVEDHGSPDLKSMNAAGNSATSSGFSYCGFSSSTSWESESADRASSCFQYWDVPTKPHRQAVNVRNSKQPWPHAFLSFPSTPVAAAVHDTHGNVGEFSYDDKDIKPLKLCLDDDGGNFTRLSYDSNVGKFRSGNGGGGHRRSSAGRQRDRQKKEGICSHCRATDTAQWRAGPNGPGTLCNACGIRYRMGGDKLVPEYCPSTSPFFRNGEHSNRHSNVEKLREKKVKDLKVSFLGSAGASIDSSDEVRRQCT